MFDFRNVINDSANLLTPSIPDSPEALRSLSHQLKPTEGSPQTSSPRKDSHGYTTDALRSDFVHTGVNG
jgi:hypothetical protein